MSSSFTWEYRFPGAQDPLDVPLSGPKQAPRRTLRFWRSEPSCSASLPGAATARHGGRLAPPLVRSHEGAESRGRQAVPRGCQAFREYVAGGAGASWGRGAAAADVAHTLSFPLPTCQKGRCLWLTGRIVAAAADDAAAVVQCSAAASVLLLPRYTLLIKGWNQKRS